MHGKIKESLCVPQGARITGDPLHGYHDDFVIMDDGAGEEMVGGGTSSRCASTTWSVHRGASIFVWFLSSLFELVSPNLLPGRVIV